MGSCLRKAPNKPAQNDELPPEPSSPNNPNIVSALHLQPVRINSLKSPVRLKSKSWLADDLSSDGGSSDSPAPSKLTPSDASSKVLVSLNGGSLTPSNNNQTSPTRTNESDDPVFISPLGGSYREVGDDVVAEGIDPLQRDTLVLVSKAANSTFRQKRISYSDTSYQPNSQHNLLSEENSMAEDKNESRASFFDAPDFDPEEQVTTPQAPAGGGGEDPYTPTKYGNLPEYLPYIMQEDNQANIINRRSSKKQSHMPSFIQAKQAQGDSDDEVQDDDDDHSQVVKLTPFGSRSQNSSFYQQTPSVSNNNNNNTADDEAITSASQTPIKSAVKRHSSQQGKVDSQQQQAASADEDDTTAEQTTPRRSSMTRRRSQSHSTIMEMFVSSPSSPVPVKSSDGSGNFDTSINNNTDLIIPETRPRADSAPESVDDEAVIFAGAAGKNVDRSFLTDLAKERSVALSPKKSENSEHDEEKLRHFARLGRAAVVTSGKRSSLLAGRGGRGPGSAQSQELLRRASTITPATKITG